MDTIIFFVLPLILIPIYIQKPAWGLAIIIGLTIFFREGWHPELTEVWTFYSMNLLNIRIMEVLIYTLLIVTVLNRKILGKAKFWMPPYSGILMIFMCLILAAALHGLLQGATFRAALGYGEWRALLMAMLLLVLVPNIRDTPEKVRKFMNGVFILAALRACIGVGDYWLGQGQVHATLQTRVIFWDSGENILFAMLIVVTLAEFLIRRPITVSTLLRGAACLPMIYSVLFSLRRNTWLFIAVSILVMFVLVSVKQKMRFVFAGLLGVLLLSAVFITGGGGGQVQSIVNRAGSFLNTKTDTNAFHLYDIYDAFLTICEQPWIGVGFGNGFTRIRTLHGVGAENISPNIVHNVYLHIWVKMGILGLVVFLLFWITYLAYGIQGIFCISDQYNKSIVIGLMSIVFGLLAMFIWGTDLFANTRTPILVFTFLGIVGTFIRPNTKDAPA